jgi:hypothetical protein
MKFLISVTSSLCLVNPLSCRTAFCIQNVFLVQFSFLLFDGCLAASWGCYQKCSHLYSWLSALGSYMHPGTFRVVACWYYGSLLAKGTARGLFHICPKVHSCLQPLAFQMRWWWLAIPRMASTYGHGSVMPFQKRINTMICPLFNILTYS